MKAIFGVIPVVMAAALLASCASTQGTGSESVESTTQGTPGAQASGLQGTYDRYDARSSGGGYGYGQGGQGGQGMGGAGPAGIQRVVYFDFDSYEVRPDGRAVVEANARYLTSNPGAAVILEGHTDERGTREYNIGLGDRRAEAVRRLMNALGVSPQQIRTISYGEERPAVAGHDETSYNQNRRVEIAY